MTKDEALAFDLALKALKKARSRIVEAGGSGWKLEAQQCVNAITAIKQARSAPVQERKPVCWDGEDKCPNRQACCDAQHCLYTTPPAAVVNQQLTTEPATPLQEPPPECQTEAEKRAYAFGWWKALEANRVAPVQDIGVEQDERVFARIEARKNRDAAHKETAQRQWVGLTDDEILKLAYPIRWQEVDDFEADKAVNFAQAIEAKLREKNGGQP